MKERTYSQTKKAVRRHTVRALLLLALGLSSPVHATGSAQLPVVGPQVPSPQGILTVYSERYVVLDSDAPMFFRRPFELYSTEGRLVSTYNNSLGDGPIRIVVPPGQYLIVSESHWARRTVRAEVENGRETVVSEELLEEAPLFSSFSSR
ncbi:MAG TPA: hypothetical protein VKK81_06165 [Candidatus Binatia bacterium]|nr:hypothetical protein [Candidatus Binatia bacterium]